MELIVILLCSLSGALAGTAMGILLMFRRIRQPATEAELALVKDKLKSSDASLAARAADMESLRGQIAERDQTIQRNTENLREMQQHLDVAVAERAVTEQKARELTIQAEALAEQRAQLEARLKEEKDLDAEIANQQVATYGAQLDAEKQRVQELTEQAARLMAETAEIKAGYEEEKLRRLSLETKLGGEVEHIWELTSQVQALQSERLLFDTKLQEERQSAAKGMELLLMAQESLKRVFESAGVAAPNGSNGHGPLGEHVEAIHPALAGNDG